MEEKLLVIKATIVAGFTALSAALGWKGIMVVVWIAVMILDYISGTCAACKQGQWCSEKARSGIWHKAGMLMVVLVAGIADMALSIACEHLALGITYSGLLLPLVLAWYIITELGSILENAIKLGAAVPEWLTKMLKAGLSAVDKLADKNNTEETPEHVDTV